MSVIAGIWSHIVIHVKEGLIKKISSAILLLLSYVGTQFSNFNKFHLVWIQRKYLKHYIELSISTLREKNVKGSLQNLLHEEIIKYNIRISFFIIHTINRKCWRKQEYPTALRCKGYLIKTRIWAKNTYLRCKIQKLSHLHNCYSPLCLTTSFSLPKYSLPLCSII